MESIDYRLYSISELPVYRIRTHTRNPIAGPGSLHIYFAQSAESPSHKIHFLDFALLWSGTVRCAPLAFTRYRKTRRYYVKRGIALPTVFLIHVSLVRVPLNSADVLGGICMALEAKSTHILRNNLWE